jgi:hypothetical protein
MATNKRAKSKAGAFKSKRGKSKDVIEKRSNRSKKQRTSDVEAEVLVEAVTQYTSDEEDDNQEDDVDEGQNLKPRQLPYDSSGKVSSL